jgi:alkylhydroperoxidase/carboxymuconolactone decarboxylase family protein YurZ
LSLTDPDRRLLRLFLACVIGNWEEVRRLRGAAGQGEPNRRWREALLQVHLFAGIPRQIEAAGILVTAGGLGALDSDELEGTSDVRERGAALFDRIYVDDADVVRAMLARGHPDFERWVLEHAYGRVLSRPGLSPDRRELLAVVALAALAQERQLASHVRGARRCGASDGEISAALEAVSDLMEPGRLEAAHRLIARLS